MQSLNELSARVIQEFGNVLPDTLLSFEDARREVLQTYALEMQKLGISPTNRTVGEKILSHDERVGLLPENMNPAFCEFHSNLAETDETREKVEIVPLDHLPTYEGSRAIAFFGTPLKFKAAWDFWDYGTLYLSYDPIPQIGLIKGSDSIVFPPAFYTLLVKKSAANLVPVVQLKFSYLAPEEKRELMPVILPMLKNLEAKLDGQTKEWEKEMKKFTLSDLNQGAHLRRTNDELQARSYHNITRRNPLDFLS
jgi:hypothetical protein